MALFQCHACELRREVSNKHVGKQVECPQCKTLVTVTMSKTPTSITVSKKIKCRCGNSIEVPDAPSRKWQAKCVKCGLVISKRQSLKSAAQTDESTEDDWLADLAMIETKGKSVRLRKLECEACHMVVALAGRELPPDSCPQCEGQLIPHKTEKEKLAEKSLKREHREAIIRNRDSWAIFRNGLDLMHVSSRIYLALQSVGLAISGAVLVLLISVACGVLAGGAGEAVGEAIGKEGRNLAPIGSAVGTALMAGVIVSCVITAMGIVFTVTRVFFEEYLVSTMCCTGAWLFCVWAFYEFPWLIVLMYSALICLLPVNGVVAMIGFSMCCSVPKEANVRGWMGASTFWLFATIATYIGVLVVAANTLAKGNFLGAIAVPLAIYLMVAACFCWCAAQISLAIVLHGIGRFFNDPDLPRNSMRFIQFQGVYAALNTLALVLLVALPSDNLRLYVAGAQSITAVIGMMWFMRLTRSGSACILC